ncbi:hypothetical protein ABT237_23040 [Streptomyces sp. NPDC001581]|uniref:hypothetical protein n=1 Tax=Streptomyces sp. NPDC001581 TaxID=3154386 RepID=UPI0033255519
MLHSHAVNLDGPPRTAIDDVLDLAAARLTRRPPHPPPAAMSCGATPRALVSGARTVSSAYWV